MDFLGYITLANFNLACIGFSYYVYYIKQLETERTKMVETERTKMVEKYIEKFFDTCFSDSVKEIYKNNCTQTEECCKKSN